MVKIKAFAVPFNQANSYNELLTPGAFTQFLRTNKKQIPMKLGHEITIGFWNKAHQDSTGLYVEGEVHDPEGIASIRRGEIKEVSISFSDEDVTDELRKAKEKKDYATLDRLFKFNHPISRQIRSMDKEMGEPPVITKRAALSEISLVDKGAFHGTSFTIEEMDADEWLAEYHKHD